MHATSTVFRCSAVQCKAWLRGDHAPAGADELCVLRVGNRGAVDAKRLDQNLVAKP